MKHLAIGLILTVFVFHISGQEIPNYDSLQKYANLNGFYTCICDGDSIISSWKSGTLNGKYRSYYKNGQLKAKGQYTNNVKNGKWIVYSENGKAKLRILFNRYRSTNVKRVNTSKKGGVFLGRGKIFFDYTLSPIYTNKNFSEEKINGEVRFRRGKKYGKQIEYYSNGDLYSISEFKNGVYDGNRTVYYHGSRMKLDAHYKNGIPVGTRTEFSSSGDIIRQINYISNYSNMFFIDKFDISQSFSTQILIDSTFPEIKSIFFSSDINPLTNLLNQAFVFGKINAFEDEFMQTVFNPTHNRNNLSGRISDSAEDPIFTGLILKNDVVFNQQNWLMYMYPLALQTIDKFNNKPNRGVWIYLPEARKDIENIGDYIKKLKTLTYPYIVLSENNNIENFIKNRVKLVEQEHNFWVNIYGLANKD